MKDDDLFARHESARQQPPPLWVLGAIMAVIFAGGLFLVSHSGGFQSDVFDTNRLPGVDGGNMVEEPRVMGKRVFLQNCAVCHQPNGEGLAGSFPPLAGSEWLLAREWHGDNHVVRIVLQGFQGPVIVNGQTYNNAMAPWGGVMTDEQIAAVLTYVRGEWGNSAPSISKDYVAKVREETKGRSQPWTPKDLQALPKEMAPAKPAPAVAPGVSP